MKPRIETRCTDWWSVEGRPGWEGSDIAAYRIWEQFDGLRWFQRHEWKFKDGTTRLQDWINSIPGWLPHSRPLAKKEAA